jgi:hypothetical protein
MRWVVESRREGGMKEKRGMFVGNATLFEVIKISRGK